MFSAGFDLILWDACFWPGAFFQDLVGIPNSVELFPTAMLMPWYWEFAHSIPNPVAYAPQVGLPYTPNMVCPSIRISSSSSPFSSSASFSSCSFCFSPKDENVDALVLGVCSIYSQSCGICTPSGSSLPPKHGTIFFLLLPSCCSSSCSSSFHHHLLVLC